jgi:hypothetical protein
MLAHEAAQPDIDLRAAAAAALEETAQRCGLDSHGARLIRLFATAVYHLPAAGAVARIGVVTSPDSVRGSPPR